MTAPVDDPDAELVERVGRGDPAAVQALMARKLSRMLALSRRMLGDPAEAEDVAQEVFLRAWRGLPQFEERSRFSTWLYRIAFNEAQRRLSRRTLPRAAPAPEPDAPDPVAALPAPLESGPEARALAGEFERTLDAALGQLPPEWRAAVVLRDIEGLSTRDAAEIAGVGEAAFKSRLHRGRMQLRDLLEPYLGLDPGG